MSKNMPVVARLLQDTVRVIQEYRLPLRSHALHAYHSAFVTMPQCLLLETLQQQSLPRLLPTLTSPRALHWGSWNRVIEGHEDEVLCVAVSPDGQRIVSGSKDGTVRVWSAVTLEELARLDPGKYHAASVAFSPDGARFVTISVAGIIHVWDSVTFQRLIALELNREAISQYGRAPSNVSAFCVVFSKDGTRMVASAGNAICIWSAIAFEELGTINGSAPLALSPDGTRIIACRFDTPAESAVYDATTFEELFSLKAFASDVRAIAFSPNGQQVVFGLSDNTLSVLNAANWKETISLGSGREIASATALSFSPCGTRIICASSDLDLHLWDTAGHQELARFKGHEKSASDVAFSPDGTKIVSGSRDKTVRVWSAVDLEDSLSLENDRAHRQWSRKIAFLPGGSSIISRSVDEPVRIWNSETLNELGELEHTPRAGDAHVIVWSLDGSLATTLYGPHNSLRVWNTMTFEMAAELNGELDVNCSFACAAFSPDNKRIVTGMRHGAVLIWDILSSEVLAELNGQSNPIRCVAYSPGGSHIASGDELTLRIWDAATYEEFYVFSSIGAVTRLDFSYDGSRLVAAFFIKKSQGTICVVCSVDKFQVIAQFESETYREPSFTADGTGILFSNLEGTTSAWMPSQQNKGTRDLSSNLVYMILITPFSSCVGRGPAVRSQPSDKHYQLRHTLSIGN
jgi:WD40 repeat protein